MTEPIQWTLLLLGQNGDRYVFRRISEEAPRSNVSLIVAHYSDIEVSIDQKKIDLLIDGSYCLSQIQAVIFYAPGSYTVVRNFLIGYFSSLGLYILNGESLRCWPTLNKLIQVYELQRAGIPVIPTRVFGNCSNLSAGTRDGQISMVAKSVDGSGGRSTWEVNSQMDLQQGP